MSSPLSQHTITQNPIKSARELLNLSIDQLSTAASIHRQVIIRTEQGCYAKIPPKLHRYLLSRLGHCDVTSPIVYSRWVNSRRVSNYGKLTRALPGFEISSHPFIQWREASELKRTQFCINFCVHTSTVSRFETNLVQSTVPEQLREALLISGYAPEILDELSIRYHIYREYQLAINNDDTDRLAFAKALGTSHEMLQSKLARSA